MEPASSLQFAAAARALADACRCAGVLVPSFRSPPRLAGADRSLRRRPEGGAVVSVRLAGRPFVAVLADMVDGAVAASGVEGVRAQRLRAALWEALAPPVADPAGHAVPVVTAPAAPAPSRVA